MTGHTLAPSTQTLVLRQVSEVNEWLTRLQPPAGENPLLTAERLGLDGNAVHPRVLDRTVSLGLARKDRQGETLVLPPTAPLLSLLAVGDPNWPYLYGLFGEVVGRRRLPALMRTEHLLVVSSVLGLHRHHWEH